MPAYLIYRAYMARTPDAVAAFGGRFLARGSEIVPLEGKPETVRVIITEFPSPAAAQAFYDSDIYRAAIPFRQDVANMQMVVVDGFAT